jgi:hypothetical protein
MDNWHGDEMEIEAKYRQLRDEKWDLQADEEEE